MFRVKSDHILTSYAEVIESGRVDLAIAFWGRGAAKRLRLQNAENGSRVLLNADSGACNPKELRILMQLGNIEVRNASRLHAKVVIGLREFVVGSANASANGLGYEAGETSGWSEASYVVSRTRDLRAAKAWFEKSWEAAEPLTESVMKRVDAAYSRMRRRALEVVEGEAGSGDHFGIEQLQGAPVFIALFDERINKATRKAFQEAVRKSGKAYGVKFDFFGEWGKMPKDALLFSYLYYAAKGGERDVLEYDWPWDTKGTFKVRGNGSTGHVVRYADKKTLRAYRMPDNVGSWKQSVRGVIGLLRNTAIRKGLVRNSTAQINRATDWCMSLYEFLEFCKTNKLIMPSPWRNDNSEM